LSSSATHTPLTDTFGRTVTNVRISVTDRCNFRCRYCMPEEGMQWMDRHELLSYEEIARLVRILAQHGVRKIRLTGGEPLMRKDLDHLVRMLVTIPGIDDCALTTNGVFLVEQAAALKAAGLHRVNVSLDSLDPETFTSMTRRDHFDEVWKGIEAADAAGLRPVKLNVVLIRGVNDHEVPKFARLARGRGFIPRFIEFMPIGMGDDWSRDKVVAGREVVAAMEAATGVRLHPVEKAGAQPADRFVFEDGVGEIGFINSVSEPFCGNCDRIRITSDGKLRTCLFSLGEVDLRALVRSGAADASIAEAIRAAVVRKEGGHLINDPAFVRPERTMSQIGG
jgi:cyclic pyranopterin phosphate synthase